MPYSRLLKRILENVEGAVGVGFVDYEGETVQLAGRLQDYAHRVHLAHQSILLQNVSRIHQKYQESLSLLTCVCQDLTWVIKPLKSGYCLVVTLNHRKNLSKAAHYLEEAARELNQEL
jgi:hypothetical protein